MSKKVSEAERYERMEKLEKEAKIEKRKSEGGAKKRNSLMKQIMDSPKKGSKAYEEDEYLNY